MRNAKAVVALVVGLCALAGCTGGSSPVQDDTNTTSSTPPGSTSGSASATGSPDMSAPTGVPTQPPQSTAAPLPGGSTEVPAVKVDASTLSDTYQRQVAASADGRTLRVVGVAGGCKTASAEVTAESADAVMITLVTTYYPPAGGGVCTQELRDVPLNVTLAAPLGDRRVVLEAREDGV